MGLLSSQFFQKDMMMMRRGHLTRNARNQMEISQV